MNKLLLISDDQANRDMVATIEGYIVEVQPPSLDMAHLERWFAQNKVVLLFAQYLQTIYHTIGYYLPDLLPPNHIMIVLCTAEELPALRNFWQHGELEVLLLPLNPLLLQHRLDQITRYHTVLEQRLAEDRLEILEAGLHAIRTPTTPIVGYSRLLLMGAFGSISEDQAMMLMYIEENSQAIATFMGHIRDKAQVAAHRLTLKHKPIDFYEVLKSVVEQLKRMQHITPQLDTQPPLPLIWGDAYYLQNALVLLIEQVVNRACSLRVKQTTQFELAIELVEPIAQATIQRDLEQGWQSNLRFVRYIIEQHQGMLQWNADAEDMVKTILITLPIYTEGAAS